VHICSLLLLLPAGLPALLNYLPLLPLAQLLLLMSTASTTLMPVELSTPPWSAATLVSLAMKRNIKQNTSNANTHISTGQRLLATSCKQQQQKQKQQRRQR
jgi:hypothetical protein